MITKAIVEDIVDEYSIRVRIPSIDRVLQSNIHVNTDELDVAVVCTLPGCKPNLQRGDVVIVAYDAAEEDTIILGHLYRSKKTDTYIDLILSSINVNNHAILPQSTQIGSVTSREIQCLSGAKDNLQAQITSLQEQVSLLLNKYSSS